MKKVIILFLSATLLFSCSAPKGEVFDWTGKLSAIVETTYSGISFKIRFIRNEGGDFSTEIISPESLSGVKFIFTGTESYAVKDDVKIPVRATSLTGIITIAEAFTLQNANITGIQTGELDGATYTVVTAEKGASDYTVFFASDNVPEKIIIGGENELELKISDFLIG